MLSNKLNHIVIKEKTLTFFENGKNNDFRRQKHLHICNVLVFYYYSELKRLCQLVSTFLLFYIIPLYFIQCILVFSLIVKHIN